MSGKMVANYFPFVNEMVLYSSFQFSNIFFLMAFKASGMLSFICKGDPLIKALYNFISFFIYCKSLVTWYPNYFNLFNYTIVNYFMNVTNHIIFSLFVGDEVYSINAIT